MIIFLYGEDSFRSGQKLLEIKKKFFEKDPSGSGFSEFDFSDKNKKNKILDVFGMANLLSPKRLVVAKNLISGGTDREQDEVLAYLKKNKFLAEDTDLIVVFCEDSQPKKSNAIFKFLQKGGKVQDFEKLQGAKLSNWILKRMGEVDPKANISKSALEKLIIFGGSDTFLLDKEIQKLANFCDSRMIKDEDVELLVKANISGNIFSTIDALGNNNKKTALKLLHQHIMKGEDPFYILSMFIYQFRNLIKIADLKDNFGMHEQEIVRISKLHPYVVKKSLGQIRNFSADGQAFDKLRKIYQKLSDLDTKVKTGKIEIKMALDKFIVEL
ncbi:MAG TPA: DNA polymerase III subunit delta [Candidatus Moranbacteria bacterium]|nr:DNA polymerase III subunit delta [Candidatus Moranbacteria bacterium]